VLVTCGVGAPEVSDTRPVTCSGNTDRADGPHARTANGVSRYASQTRPVMLRPSSLSTLDSVRATRHVQ